MKIKNDINYVGVNDHNIDLFESQFKVPHGMSYNSYVILDDKIAIMDSVESHFGEEWLKNIASILGDKKPDYLVVQHMEMDHSANILKFTEKYPEAKIVSSGMSFIMMKNMFETDFSDKQVVVAEGSTLELGKHVLKFIASPNVHWPEVIMTYDSTDKVLFSADAFGKFGALDINEEWDCEARRYYFGIIGKFGASVQDLLKKISNLEINTICPLHGPFLSENLQYYINLYDIWSSYKVESDGIVIAYTSVYGNTKMAVEKLAEVLKTKGCTNVITTDLARDDMSEAVENAFRYGKLVLATTTYCGDIFPFMKEFINHLKDRNYQNRKIAFIENGSWAPMAARGMATLLDGLELQYCENKVTIKIAVNEDTINQIENLADELVK